MADTRINALSTATSSASDDFVPIDGTTNGTRKLSAYSPSFGGNATVGGTLTVNGNVSVNSSSNAGLKALLTNTSAGTGAYVEYELSNNTDAAGVYVFGTGWTTSGRFIQASTLVDSSASGGLTIASTGTTPIRFWLSSEVARFSPTNGNLLIGGTTDISGSGGLKVFGTTASTSTSSGALVVSGGVGVAGSQYLGVKLNISTHTGDAGGIGFGTETNLYRYQAGGLALDHASGAAPGFLFRENGTSTLRLESNSGVGYLSTLTSANLILRTNATTALTLDTSQNAIFAGTVRTAAPSGGTAASWKLGSVATVSPTSPNRTIEVDIGGTIYYIHAKTTNN
jgi:hypothetical protein